MLCARASCPTAWALYTLPARLPSQPLHEIQCVALVIPQMANPMRLSADNQRTC